MHTLIDEDGDGYAPEHLDCDGRGGDCDDTDPDINPGMPEICGDGVDRNCSGDPDEASTWYHDCDGDGYASESALGNSVESCDPPDPDPGCDGGWTVLRPSDLNTIDCDDSNPGVYPGARNSSNDGYYTRPYCRGSGQLANGLAPDFNCDGMGGSGALSWDYDCNGSEDRRYRATNVNICTEFVFYPTAEPVDGTSSTTVTTKASLADEVEPTGTICCVGCFICTSPSCSTTRAGYIDSEPPDCGHTATWRQCTGRTGCECYNCDTCYCGSDLSQRRQQCR